MQREPTSAPTPMSASSAYRCSTCQGTSENSRNLVVFIDGTGNKLGNKNTNVMKLYQKLVDGHLSGPGLEQRKCYLRGIGTFDVDHLTFLERVVKTIHSGLEMALAWNVEENVKNAYRWLAEHYQAGDRIYLFGFSRGAYQVRALASMIHEVGLVKVEEKGKTDEAYNKYLAINPYNPDSRIKAIRFKQSFCRYGVRIHFVGVWDTVSSLGLVRRDVHVTASASVTNACHFRHALSLDERRVKFMPEYFLEMNARSQVGDVQEVWFAGSHSDVGGIDRPPEHEIRMHSGDDNIENYANMLGSFPSHAGNVSLSWMRLEAAANGLIFEPREFIWGPQDIDFCVSFGGTGKHKWRLHLFRPRVILPGQEIHDSALSSALYAPRATLPAGVCIPVASMEAAGNLQATGQLDGEATTRLLSSLLKDPRRALEHFERSYRSDPGAHQGLDIEQIKPLLGPSWSREGILGRSDAFARFALIVIYDVASNFTASEELVTNAKTSLKDIIRPSELPTLPNATPVRRNVPRTLYILRFLIRQQRSRQRFIDDDVINTLVLSLDTTAKSPNDILFLLTTECLYYLARDGQLQDGTIRDIQSKLEKALGSRSFYQLVSLKMIASIAEFREDLSEASKDKISKLAKRGRGPIGSTAVGALAALQIPFKSDIHIPNVLGYLADNLPRLDAELDGASSADRANNPSQLDPEVGGDTLVGDTNNPEAETSGGSMSHNPADPSTGAGSTSLAAEPDGRRPPVTFVVGSGSFTEAVMREAVLTVKSNNAHKRTVATVAVLKLCGNLTNRKFCLSLKVMDTFVGQLKQKETSLLAAYALKTCLKYDDMWSHPIYASSAKLITAMLKKGWFDGAVGRVEGHEIFLGLMSSENLRKQAQEGQIVETLVQKLEAGKRHDVRMSLLCLDILGEARTPLNLNRIVIENVNRLRDEDKEVQRKGVKVLAALAQMPAGEVAIREHVLKIVDMVLSSLPQPKKKIPKKLFGPITALYDLSKIETLRLAILESDEFGELKQRIQPSIPHFEMT